MIIVWDKGKVITFIYYSNDMWPKKERLIWKPEQTNFNQEVKQNK